MGADHDVGAWVGGLGASGPAYDETVARLNDLLLRVARAEVHRRRAQLSIASPELDHLAHQAAAGASGSTPTGLPPGRTTAFAALR